ncbi:MAG: hypothetical protein KDI09_13535 [Halioglobus sp.]|nr:hypothetical protein [Halioglobus sp.]
MPGIRQLATTLIAISEVFNSIRDYMLHTAEADAALPRASRFADCMPHPGNEPQPGVALDDDRAARHAHRSACLPVNQLEDCSKFDW